MEADRVLGGNAPVACPPMCPRNMSRYQTEERSPYSEGESVGKRMGWMGEECLQTATQ